MSSADETNQNEKAANAEISESSANFLDKVNVPAVNFLLRREYLNIIDVRDMDFSSSKAREYYADIKGFSLKSMHYLGDKDPSLEPDNISSFLGVFKNLSANLSYVVSGKKDERVNINFFAMPRAECYEVDDGFADTMKKNFMANFKGAKIQDLNYRQDYNEHVMKYIDESLYFGALLGIPSRKETTKGNFIQGIEKILDSLKGEDFMYIVLAEPIPDFQAQAAMNNISNFINELKRFEEVIITKSVSESTSKSTSKTVGGNASHSSSESKTYFGSGGMLLAAAQMLPVALGPVIGPAISVCASLCAGALDLPLMKTLTETCGLGGFASGSKTTTTTQSHGTSSTEKKTNHGVKKTCSNLETHFERLESSSGQWNVGVYIFAKDKQSYQNVQATIGNHFSGHVSHLEPIRKIDLGMGEKNKKNENLIYFKAAVKGGYIPDIDLFNEAIIAKWNEHTDLKSKPKHPFGPSYDRFSTPMNSNELSIYLAPPQRENSAIPVVKRGTFGGSLPIDTTPGKKIPIAKMLDCGYDDDTTISLPLKDLTKHLFVAGVTGSGKTNTVHNICNQVNKQDINYLVIEPSAKTEYRQLPHCHVYSLGTEGVNLSKHETCGAPLRFNPFFFPEGTEIQSHISDLKVALCSMFSMYASMPEIVRSIIKKAYINKGWHVDENKNTLVTHPWADKSCQAFPRLSDFYNLIDSEVPEQGYAPNGELEQNIRGALKSRIKSLTEGSKGRMLDVNSGITIDELLSTNTVLEMKYIGDDDEKVFITGLLLNAIYKKVSHEDIYHNKDLKHLIVIEEAHRLFKNSQQSNNPEIANPRARAVEAFANTLAEIRSFGCGVIVVDQTPNEIIPDVIKNTATKIIHQLAAKDDRDIIGDSMNLGETEKADLSILKTGEAIIYKNGWDRAVMAKMDLFENANQNDVAAIRHEIMAKHPERYARTNFDGNDSLALEIALCLSYNRMDLCADLIDRVLADKELGQPEEAIMSAFQIALNQLKYTDDMQRALSRVKDSFQSKNRQANLFIFKKYFKKDTTKEQETILRELIKQKSWAKLVVENGLSDDGKKFKALDEKLKQQLEDIGQRISDEQFVEKIKEDSLRIVFTQLEYPHVDFLISQMRKG
ncbi:MAG: ATP-binding protein [Akkermansia sp.]